MKKISIIIVTWNNLAYTKILYNSLLKYTTYKPLEIIFIDNGSEDGTVQWIKKLKNPNVKGVFNRKKLGPIKAKNIGMREATGEYYCLLDNDIRVCTQDWLRKMMKALHSKKIIAAVAPRCNLVFDDTMLRPPHITLKALRKNKSFTLDFEKWAHIDKYRERKGPAYEAGENIEEKIVEYLELMTSEPQYPEPFKGHIVLEGGGTLIKKDVIDKIGLIDEGFGFAWNDGWIWNQEIKKLKMETYVVSNVFIFHYAHGTANFRMMPNLKEKVQVSDAYLKEMRKKYEQT